MESHNERIIEVELEIYGREIVIIGVYGPTDDSQMQDKDEFFECLNATVEKINRRKEIILTGDLNGRTGRRANDTVIGSFGEDCLNDNGERIIELCELQNLRVLNGFYRHKDIHKFTWTQETRRLRSIIDYVVMKQKTSIRVKDVRVKRGPECGSDHRLLLARLECPWNGCKSMDQGSKGLGKGLYRGKGKKSISWICYKNKAVRELYQRRLDQQLTDFMFDSVEDIYTHIKQCMQQAALEVLGEKNEENRKYKYNLTEVTLQEIKIRKCCMKNG
ncbi:hypothetical protein LSTR_LSTR001752 [Laodelphax striatellus]|uniref:Endonuclease/exonuclease/phosphatase domain-containing protein n=1 Tax=Laodelphax striatellus TaxID=195883 RepID=A0A482WFP5_LAOST|nr:hypothetical protein LSTR_LSTR001752 [Laodelphax striatellus]